MPLEPLPARVLQIAAGLPEASTVALTGGGAMLAHGFVDRATKDIDQGAGSVGPAVSPATSSMSSRFSTGTNRRRTCARRFSSGAHASPMVDERPA